MVRRFLAMLAGVAVYIAVVLIADAVSHAIHPMPESVEPGDVRAMIAHIESAPFSAMLVVMLGWIVGTFAGAFTASKITLEQHRLVAGIVGAVAFAGAAMNIFMIPHPLWMSIIGLAGIAVAAHLGWKLGERQTA